MKRRNLSFIGIATVIIGLLVASLFTNKDEEDIFYPLGFDFSYSEAHSQLQDNLESGGILMSSPIVLKSKDSIEEYCTFFEDPAKQRFIEYCTSTELKNSHGEYLGNIHIVGSSESPKIVIALAQSDPFHSQLDDIKSIFEIVIGNLVCDCWGDLTPGGFNSIGDWIDETKQLHLDARKPTTKSKISGLENNNLLLELSTNQQGYLWKLLIEK